jgi:uncharacterized membrane protein
MLKRILPNLMLIFGTLVLITGLVQIFNYTSGANTTLSDVDVIVMFITGCSLVSIGLFLQAYQDRTQSKEDRSRRISASLVSFFFSVVILFLILGTSSCTTQGYGCKGNSKNMLRVPRYY